MMQLWGSILVAGAAAYMGYHVAARLRRQVCALDELAAGMQLLEQELELSAPELEALMIRLSQRTRGAARRMFSTFARSLTQLDDSTAAQLWEQVVFELADVSDEAKQCVCSLGDILGRYDNREQRLAVAAVRIRLEDLRKQEENTCRMRCRTCQTIALSGGAFLIILLL